MSASTGSTVRKIFVVIDPKRLVQPALEKAEWIAQRNGATLELYCAVSEAAVLGDEALEEQLIERTRAAIERHIRPAREAGIEIAVKVEAHEDWRRAIASAAAGSGADLVIKTASPRGQLRRRLMETSDWTLLRNCARPVLLVNQYRSDSPRVVLAAVKLRPGTDVYEALNARIVDTAHRIAGLLDAELHAVTVYKGEGIYFDRQRFADACRLPRSRVHATEGSSYEGIAEVAANVGAGVVIVGSAPRPARGSVLGATAERVIDEVDADVVVLPAA